MQLQLISKERLEIAYFSNYLNSISFLKIEFLRVRIPTFTGNGRDPCIFYYVVFLYVHSSFYLREYRKATPHIWKSNN